MDLWAKGAMLEFKAGRPVTTVELTVGHVKAVKTQYATVPLSTRETGSFLLAVNKRTAPLSRAYVDKKGTFNSMMRIDESVFDESEWEPPLVMVSKTKSKAPLPTVALKKAPPTETKLHQQIRRLESALEGEKDRTKQAQKRMRGLDVEIGEIKKQRTLDFKEKVRQNARIAELSKDSRSERAERTAQRKLDRAAQLAAVIKEAAKDVRTRAGTGAVTKGRVEDLERQVRELRAEKVVMKSEILDLKAEIANWADTYDELDQLSFVLKWTVEEMNTWGTKVTGRGMVPYPPEVVMLGC